jgi:hypothetical protein
MPEGWGRIVKMSHELGRGLAESEFDKFVDDNLKAVLSNLRIGATEENILAPLVAFCERAGQKLRVRMPGGPQLIYRAFNVLNPSDTPRRTKEAPASTDQALPVYTFTDYDYLDELAHSFRMKADELGLEWNRALSVLKSRLAAQHRSQSGLAHQERDSNVAARRTVLRNMMSGGKKPSDDEVCKRWDFHEFPIPENWHKYNVDNWLEALSKLPKLVCPLISKDRGLVKKRR